MKCKRAEPVAIVDCQDKFRAVGGNEGAVWTFETHIGSAESESLCKLQHDPGFNLELVPGTNHRLGLFFATLVQLEAAEDREPKGSLGQKMLAGIELP